MQNTTLFANDFLCLFSSRVWGGTAAELSLLISDIPTASRDSLKLRKVVCTQTSVVYVLPSPNDEVLVESHNRSYTANDNDDFFSELLASRSEKKNYGKGDRTLFVWNQSSYNREVSFQEWRIPG